MNALNNDDLQPLHRASRSGRCSVVIFFFAARTWRKSQHLYQVRVDSDALASESCEGELLIMQPEVITCGAVRLLTFVVVTVGHD